MKVQIALAALVALPLLAAMAAGAETKIDTGEHGKQLYHIVLLKFKETATPEQIKEVEDAFAGLKTKVPGVVSLHYGANVSPEHRNQGFTHAFVLTFASNEDRDAYLAHPEHKAFGKILGPVMADVLVVDFWSEP